MSSNISYQNLRKEFKLDDSVVIQVSSRNQTFSPIELCELKHWFEALPDKWPFIENILSPFEIRRADLNLSSGQPVLFYPLLIETSCGPDASYNIENFKKSKWFTLFSSGEFQDLLFTVNLKNEKNYIGPYGTFNYSRVNSLMELAHKELPFPIQMTGTSIFQKYAVDALDFMDLLNFLSLVVIFIFLRFYFGTWKSGLVMTLTLLWTMTIVKGLMSLLGIGIDPLLSSLFLVLLIAVVEDFIFLIDAIQTSGALKSSFRTLLLPSFFTSITTIIGFSSLCISEVRSIFHFGLMTSVGSVLEWIAIFLLLPCWIKVFPWLGKNLTRPVSSMISWPLKAKMPRKLALLLAATTLLLPLFFSRLNLNHSPLESFSAQHPFTQVTKYLEKTRHFQNEISVEFKKGLSYLRKKELIRELEIVENISFIQGTHLALPDQITDPSLAHFIENQVSDTDSGHWFYSEGKQERIILNIQKSDMQSVQKIRDRVEQICFQECFPAAEIIAFSDFNQQLLKTLKESYFFSLIFVSLILIFLGRATKNDKIWAVLLSSAVGPTFMLMTFYILQVPVDLVTSIGLSVAVGLAGDNAVQYLLSGKNSNLKSGLIKKARASFLANFLMVLLCVPFFFSDFSTPRWLGIILIVGFVMSYIGDFWVLKGLIKDDQNGHS